MVIINVVGLHALLHLRCAISSPLLCRLLSTNSSILFIASFLFSIFLASSSHSIKCFISLCKSSLNFYISMIDSNTLSMSAFKLLWSPDSAAFYLIRAYLYSKLWSSSPCAFLNVFYWFLSLPANYLLRFMPFYSYEFICFKSDYDFMHYFYNLLVLSLSSSLSFCSSYSFLFVFETSSSLDLSPSISYINMCVLLLCR